MERSKRVIIFVVMFIAVIATMTVRVQGVEILSRSDSRFIYIMADRNCCVKITAQIGDGKENYTDTIRVVLRANDTKVIYVSDFPTGRYLGNYARITEISVGEPFLGLMEYVCVGSIGATILWGFFIKLLGYPILDTTC